jgi:hypothetical protein
MSLRVAVVCGMAAAIAVPVILARTGVMAGGFMIGRVIHLPIGGGMELHWSWPIFCITTLAVWALLAAAGER